DALPARCKHLGRRRLGPAALHLRHARADGVAGEPASDEDDEPVQPCDPIAAVGKGVDRQLELVTPGDWSGHACSLVRSSELVPDATKMRTAGSTPSRCHGCGRLN